MVLLGDIYLIDIYDIYLLGDIYDRYMILYIDIYVFRYSL